MLDKDKFYKLWMRCSLGSNTKGEVLSLYIILQFSCSLGLDNIQFFGDSRIIIDSDTKAHGINILLLSAWPKNTRFSINYFQNISFLHVSREHNVQAYLLSKKALMALDGFYFFEFWSNGSLSSEVSALTILF